MAQQFEKSLRVDQYGRTSVLFIAPVDLLKSGVKASFLHLLKDLTERQPEKIGACVMSIIGETVDLAAAYVTFTICQETLAAATVVQFDDQQPANLIATMRAVTLAGGEKKPTNQKFDPLTILWLQAFMPISVSTLSTSIDMAWHVHFSKENDYRKLAKDVDTWLNASGGLKAMRGAYMRFAQALMSVTKSVLRQLPGMANGMQWSLSLRTRCERPQHGLIHIHPHYILDRCGFGIARSAKPVLQCSGAGDCSTMGSGGWQEQWRIACEPTSTELGLRWVERCELSLNRTSIDRRGSDRHVVATCALQLGSIRPGWRYAIVAGSWYHWCCRHFGFKSSWTTSWWSTKTCNHWRRDWWWWRTFDTQEVSEMAFCMLPMCLLIWEMPAMKIWSMRSMMRLPMLNFAVRHLEWMNWPCCISGYYAEIVTLRSRSEICEL